MSVKDRVDELLISGMQQSVVARTVGCSDMYVSKRAAALGLRKLPRTETVDWAQVQAFYDEGAGITAIVARFGFSRETWGKAVELGLITVRDWKIPLHELLVKGRGTRAGHLKARLPHEGLLRRECYECGLTEWRGKPIGLEIDHINGDSDDWRLENLRMLCPNCHAQTDTYGGKNKGKYGPVV